MKLHPRNALPQQRRRPLVDIQNISRRNSHKHHRKITKKRYQRRKNKTRSKRQDDTKYVHVEKNDCQQESAALEFMMNEWWDGDFSIIDTRPYRTDTSISHRSPKTSTLRITTSLNKTNYYPKRRPTDIATFRRTNNIRKESITTVYPLIVLAISAWFFWLS
ncbi:MAG: hypothetical protein EXX96DRAFT_622021 [Benjaminiella poitrasii]|nr:MAG: hypothetical protein EXX96DRAFT_622021 [Benjaminiella poitrasii]